MQNFSYYILPLYHYPQPYSSCSQTLTLPLSLAFAGPVTSQFLPYPPALTEQTDHPVGTQGSLLVGNEGAGLVNGDASSSLGHARDVSRQRASQGFVSDPNANKYPKKNAESNLINQIFSYISIPSKSRSTLLALLEGDEGKGRVFYELMRNLKRHNKKYINRNYLKDLLLMEKTHIIHGILQKIRIETDLSAKELRTILRRMVINFLKEKCMLTILTSSKLDRFAIKQHLMRRRQVLQYLCYHLRVAAQGQ